MLSNNQPIVIDVISNFQFAGRIYVPEAIWRIFGFILSEIYPSVILSQQHLEDSQLVTYTKSDDLSKVITSDLRTRSMLTEFFRKNASSEDARQLLYGEFPEFFVWDEQNKIWTIRKQGAVISRIVTASLMEGERYYLRLLLNHIKGPTSFDNLKTVNGIIVSSFWESALLHGLLQGDDNYNLCMEEATLYQMPSELCCLFSTILACYAPNNPKLLWDKFEESMYVDYVGKHIEVIVVECKALQDVNSMLETMGKSLSDYGFVISDIDLNQKDKIAKVINEELEVLVSNDDLLSIERLNKEQKIAFDLSSKKVFGDEARAFFSNGLGGTGKTYLYQALLATVRSKNFIALAIASSGVAATILPVVEHHT